MQRRSFLFAAARYADGRIAARTGWRPQPAGFSYMELALSSRRTFAARVRAKPVGRGDERL